MGNEKKVFSASDAAPVVLYVKSNASSELAYPLLGGMSGFEIPNYDELVLSYTGSNLTGVVYKLASVTVATLTLSYTGSNLTGVVKT